MLIALDSVPDVILCIQEDGAGYHLEDLVNRLIVRLVHRIGIRPMYKRPKTLLMRYMPSSINSIRTYL